MESQLCDPVFPPTLSSSLPWPPSKVPSWDYGDYQQEAEPTGLAFCDTVAYLQGASRSKATWTREKQVVGGPGLKKQWGETMSPEPQGLGRVEITSDV